MHMCNLRSTCLHSDRSSRSLPARGPAADGRTRLPHAWWTSTFRQLGHDSSRRHFSTQHNPGPLRWTRRPACRGCALAGVAVGVACSDACMCACVHVCMCACVHAGMFTAYTGQETCKCLGVDADAEQLSIARAAALAAGCAGRVEVVHGDCTCLPLRQHSVDVTLVDLPFGKRHKSPLGIKALYSQVCMCARARRG